MVVNGKESAAKIGFSGIPIADALEPNTNYKITISAEVTAKAGSNQKNFYGLSGFITAKT